VNAAADSGSRIIRVSGSDRGELAEVRRLFGEYAEWLGSFVLHTTIDGEIASLPAPFVPPRVRYSSVSTPSARSAAASA